MGNESMGKLVIVGAVALGATVSLGAIRAVTPDYYGDDPKAWQMKDCNARKAVITNGGSRVVFIGDSITHGWDWGDAGKKQWEKYFAGEPYRALNLGISGDRTEHVLGRILKGGELDGYEAKIVFLMIGTNNTGHFPIEKETPADTILGVREVLRAISAKQPKATIALMPIFPRGRDANDSLRHRNDVVNREIMKFADGKRILWLDFTDQFLTADGLLSPELFPDRLHPNALGYEIWYSAVKPYADAAISDGKIPMPASRYASTVRRGRFRIDEGITQFPMSRIRAEGYGKEDWWLDRLLANRNQIADSKGEIDIVFFGDSITHNWDKQGKESLAELRKTYSVLNLGYSGDRTEHLVWRGENGELDGYKAKCIMLMIGTNNTWHRSDKPEAIAVGVGKVLKVIAKKQPQAKVLLLPIFPFGDSPAHENRVNNEKANEMIRSFADGKKVIWVDFNAKFLDEKGNPVKWMPDHCHPNAAGYREIWLPAVLPHFKEIVGR